MGLYYYIDWRPCASAALVPVVINRDPEKRTFSGGEKILEFLQNFSSSPHDELISSWISEFGYCERNDGIFIFYFSASKAHSNEQINHKMIARVISRAIKVRSGHIHRYDKVRVEKETQDTPILDREPIKLADLSIANHAYCNRGLEDIRYANDKQELSSFFQNLSTATPFERVCRVAGNDTALAVLQAVNEEGHQNGRIALLFLKEKFSWVFDDSFAVWAEIRQSKGVRYGIPFLWMLVAWSIIIPYCQSQAGRKAAEEIVWYLLFQALGAFFLITAVLGIFTTALSIRKFFQEQSRTTGRRKDASRRASLKSALNEAIFSIKKRATFYIILAPLFLSPFVFEASIGPMHVGTNYWKVVPNVIPIVTYETTIKIAPPDNISAIFSAVRSAHAEWFLIPFYFSLSLLFYMEIGEKLRRAGRILNMAAGVLMFANTYANVVLRILGSAPWLISPTQRDWPHYGFDASIAVLSHGHQIERRKMVLRSLVFLGIGLLPILLIHPFEQTASTVQASIDGKTAEPPQQTVATPPSAKQERPPRTR